MFKCSRCGSEFSNPLIAQIDVRWVFEGGRKEYVLNFAKATLCPQCHKEFNAFMGVKRGENNET